METRAKPPGKKYAGRSDLPKSVPSDDRSADAEVFRKAVAVYLERFRYGAFNPMTDPISQSVEATAF